jgi:hypothetical protein
MAKPSLQDLRALPDPVQTWRFSLEIPELGDGIRVRCKTAVVPGVSTDSVLVTVAGAEVKHMGREVWSHTFPFTIYETRDMYSFNKLRDWFHEGRDFAENSGDFKQAYEKTVIVTLYDDQGAEIKQITLEGCYPENIDDTQLDGSSAQAMEINATISYDFSRVTG